MKQILLLLLMLPSAIIAQESTLTKFNLEYKMPIDYRYCDSNPVECRPLPSRIPKFDIQERPDNKEWAMFWTLQILDIYTTSKALKYDCIKEINPLFTETPSDTRLVLTKTMLLAPGLLSNDYYKEISTRELENTNIMYMFVVSNNYRLLHDAKQTCNKIR